MIDWFVSILREYPPPGALPHHRHRLSCGPHPHRLFPARQRHRSAAHRCGHRPIVIPISGPIKMFFFMLFLFSIGYSVGPDFFRSLRGSGARQALFAVIMSATCCLVTLGIALLFGYSRGDGGAFLRIADLLGAPRRRHRGHTEAGLRRRHSEARARHCAGVLCRDLYFRHFRHRDHPRQSRAEAARRHRQGEGTDSSWPRPSTREATTMIPQ